MSQPQGQSNNINAEMDCAAQKTDASLVAAKGTGQALYVTDIGINGGASAITFTIKDGSTARWVSTVGSSGTANLTFKTPKKWTSNGAITVTTSGTSTGAFLSLGGFFARG